MALSREQIETILAGRRPMATPRPKTPAELLYEAINPPSELEDEQEAWKRGQMALSGAKGVAARANLIGPAAEERALAGTSAWPAHKEQMEAAWTRALELQKPLPETPREARQRLADEARAMGSGEAEALGAGARLHELPELPQTVRHILESGSRATGTAALAAAANIYDRLRRERPELTEQQRREEVIRATSGPVTSLSYPKEKAAGLWEGLKAFPPTAANYAATTMPEAAKIGVERFATTKTDEGVPAVEVPFWGKMTPAQAAILGTVASMTPMGDPTMVLGGPLVGGTGKVLGGIGKAAAATKTAQRIGKALEGTALARGAAGLERTFVGTPAYARQMASAARREGLAGTPAAQQITDAYRGIIPAQNIELGKVAEAVETAKRVAPGEHALVEASVGKQLQPEQLAELTQRMTPQAREAVDAAIDLSQRQGSALEKAQVPLREAYMPTTMADQPSKLKWWERVLGKEEPKPLDTGAGPGGIRLGGHAKARTLPERLTREATPQELVRLDELKARLDAVKKAQERYLAERTMRRVESRAEEEFYGNPWPDIPIEEALRGGAGQTRGAPGAKVIGPQGSASPVAPPPLTKEMLEAWTPGRPPRVAPGEVTSASYATTPGTQKFRTEISPRLAMTKATEREVFPVVDPLKAELSPGATPLGTVYREAMQKSPMARYERLLAKRTQAAEGKVRPLPIETASEVNEYLARTGGQSRIGQELTKAHGWTPDRPFLEPDIVKALAKRGIKGAEETAWIDFLDKTVRPFVKSVPEGGQVRTGWMRVADFRNTLPSRVLGSGLKKGETAIIPVEAGRLMARGGMGTRGIEGLEGLRPVFDFANAVGKAWSRQVTVTSGPAYHWRNVKTSLYMLGDEYGPELPFAIADAVKIAAGESGPAAAVQLAMRKAGQYGLTGRNPTVLARQIKKAAGLKTPWTVPVVGEHGVATKVGGEIAGRTDEFMRAIVVAAEMRRGKTVEEAIRRASQLITHTQDLPPILEATRKIGMPFLPWQAKQLPNVLRQAGRGRAALTSKLQSGWESATPEDTQVGQLPKIPLRMGAHPVGARSHDVRAPLYRSEGAAPPQVFSLLEPAWKAATAGLSEGARSAYELILSQLLPWLSGPLQAIEGKEAYSGQRLDLPHKAKPASELYGRAVRFLTGKTPKWVAPIPVPGGEKWLESGAAPLAMKAIPLQTLIAPLLPGQTKEDRILWTGRAFGESVYPVVTEYEQAGEQRKLRDELERLKLQRLITRRRR